MNKLLTALIFICLLPLTSGTEIASIYICGPTVDAEEGQRLTLPCTFYLEIPIEEPTIDLEWGLLKDNNTFQPIIHLRETKLLTGSLQKGRIKPNWEESNQGDCSLVIDPVQQGDHGKTYLMRLSVNGEEYQYSPTIKVYVREPQQILKESFEDLGLSTNNLLPMESYAEQSGPFTDDYKNVLQMESNTEESGPSTDDYNNVLPMESYAEESVPSTDDYNNVLPMESYAEESGPSTDDYNNVLPMESYEEQSCPFIDDYNNVLPMESYAEQSCPFTNEYNNVLPMESYAEQSGPFTDDYNNVLPMESYAEQSCPFTDEYNNVLPMESYAEKSGPSTDDYNNVLLMESNTEESGPSTDYYNNVLPKESCAEESGPCKTHIFVKHPSFRDNEKHSSRANKENLLENNEERSFRAKQIRHHGQETGILNTAQCLQTLIDNGTFLSLVIFVGILILLILLSFGFLLVRHCQRKRKSKDWVVLMEAGYAPETQEATDERYGMNQNFYHLVGPGCPTCAQWSDILPHHRC